MGPDLLPYRTQGVLVVDDEPDVTESLRHLLEARLRPAPRVRVAHTASEALRALREESFDLVLCDYKMPGRTGVDILREARRTAPGARRLLMTAYADLMVAIDAVNKAAVDAFLRKPFEPEELLARVEALLRAKRAEEQREDAFGRALARLT